MRFCRPALCRPGALLATLCLLVFAAGPASATPATFKRSIENLTQAPIDMALSPVIAARTIYRNMRDIDDSMGVRIAYPLPGWCWNTMVQIGAGTLRGVTGALELIPGILLIPFDADMDPLFDPADEQSGLVDYATPIYHIKFGIDYTTPE